MRSQSETVGGADVRWTPGGRGGTGSHPHRSTHHRNYRSVLSRVETALSTVSLSDRPLSRVRQLLLIPSTIKHKARLQCERSGGAGVHWVPGGIRNKVEITLSDQHTDESIVPRYLA